MLVTKAEVQNFIPQRKPMVMVDSLLASDQAKSISDLTIKAENIFCEEGYFTEAGLIENMAQTAALKAGYEASIKKEKVKVGFIGAVKNLQIYKLPTVGTTIKTKVTITNNFGSFTLVKAIINSNGELLAESEMTIFTQEEK